LGDLALASGQARHISLMVSGDCTSSVVIAIVEFDLEAVRVRE
jgi:hypothetical protein